MTPVLPQCCTSYLQEIRPQSAAEALAPLTAPASSANPANARDASTAMLSGCEVAGAFSHGTLCRRARLFWPALENTGCPTAFTATHSSKDKGSFL